LLLVVRRQNISSVICLSPYLLPVLMILRIATATKLILWLHTPISYFPAPIVFLVRIACLLSVCRIVVCSHSEVVAIQPSPFLARFCGSRSPLFINNFLSYNEQAIGQDVLNSMLL
jgi:hypothetical protein